MNATSFVILLVVTVEFAEWFQFLGHSGAFIHCCKLKALLLNPSLWGSFFYFVNVYVLPDLCVSDHKASCCVVHVLRILKNGDKVNVCMPQ